MNFIVSQYDKLSLDQLQILGNALIFAGAATFLALVQVARQIWRGKRNG